MEYLDFLKQKQFVDFPSGIEKDIEINSILFPFQRDIVRWGLRRGRAAVFAGCGLGKTFIQLEWAKHIPKKVLILAPLAVAKQTIREGKKIGVEVKYCRNQEQVNSKITITNYEMLERFNAPEFNGVILDESSILKNFTGSTRNLIIESFAKTPFKLACTATPAPNDYMELGNHSEFLDVMPRSEMLSMFFVHDGGETSKWRLKGHAEKDYWKWLASWAVMMQRPSDLRYEDAGFILPSLNYHEHIVEGNNGKFSLFDVDAKTLLERRQARRESLNGRVKLCAELVNQSNDIWLIWCNLNAEVNLLKKLIKDSVQVEGADSLEFKENNMLAFSDNKIKCLITKPSIAGHGMNWQNAHNMAFVGLSDSWEEYYQAVRREWRFGQKSPVNVHVIISKREGAVLKNIKRKEQDAEQMLQNMVIHMHKINEKILHKTKRQVGEYNPQIEMELPLFLKGQNN